MEYIKDPCTHGHLFTTYLIRHQPKWTNKIDGLVLCTEPSQVREKSFLFC